MMLIICIVIGLWIFIILLTSKPFKRGRKPGYPRDDGIKLNLRAKNIRIIKVTLTGGDKSYGGKECIYYEIWERHLLLFSVRYDTRSYRTIEEATHEAQKLFEYEKIKSDEKEIVWFK